MKIEVISTLRTSAFDLIFGRAKNPDEDDQYDAVIVMYEPGSLRAIARSKKLKQKGMIEMGRYLVETGSLDELSKYKELGIFSEWPRLPQFYTDLHYENPWRFGEVPDRDMKFGAWVSKTVDEYVPAPAKWWEKLLGISGPKIIAARMGKLVQVRGKYEIR